MLWPTCCTSLSFNIIYQSLFPMSDNNESNDNDSEYIFSTLEGHQLAHKVLRLQLPCDPYDAQIEGICKAVDGVDLMVLTPTGSGKTGYLTMYMLLIRSLAANPGLVLPQIKRVFQNPIMVNVFPTNGVEEEMVRSYIYHHCLNANWTLIQECEFKSHGLRAVTINVNTLSAAWLWGENLWVAVREDVSMLCLSPE